jgi:hypothetical protein
MLLIVDHMAEVMRFEFTWLCMIVMIVIHGIGPLDFFAEYVAGSKHLFHRVTANSGKVVCLWC